MSVAVAFGPELPGFEIVGQLGCGGMGVVYLARRLGPYGFDKLVALKIVRPEIGQDEEARTMLADEARLLGRLDHPAIVQVHAFEEIEDSLCVVMEHVSGVTFAKLVKRRLGPEICASLVIEVCRGLHAAHELRDDRGRPLCIVHRDVTPHNLLLTFDGRVKILDFGIALSKGRLCRATGLGIVKGKPTYLAPEQRTLDVIDRRADVYSLSVVLYELLTRKKVVSMEMARSRAWVDRVQNVVPPSTIADVSPELEAVVMRGLSPVPADRYQTMREMAAALRAAIAPAEVDLEELAEVELVEDRIEYERVVFGGPRTELVRPKTAVEQVAPGRPETPTAAGPILEVLSALEIVHPPKTVTSPAPILREASSAIVTREVPAVQRRREKKWPGWSLGFAVLVMALVLGWNAASEEPDQLPATAEPTRVTKPKRVAVARRKPKMKRDVPAQTITRSKRKPKRKSKVPAAQPLMRDGLIQRW